jgi:hypothetical protein
LNELAVYGLFNAVVIPYLFTSSKIIENGV